MVVDSNLFFQAAVFAFLWQCRTLYIIEVDNDNIRPEKHHELEQVSARLYHLSVMWNGLQRILGYDSPNEAFADVVDYEIVDQLKWLERLRNQIGSPADINDDELLELISEVDEAVRYISALGVIKDDIVEMFVSKFSAPEPGALPLFCR